MRSVGIIQPNYLPWRGYFDFISEVDVFVFLDDVQYTVRDWRNRNRVRTKSGDTIWLTVPTIGGRNQLINEVRIDTTQDWQRKHLATLESSYRGTPGFARFFPALESALNTGHEMLVDLDIALTGLICRDLGIETEFARSSDLGAGGNREEKLINIVGQLGGTRYLSGPAAKSYIDETHWRSAGIELRYKDYDGYPAYPQIAEPFVPDVSVVDVIFMLGDGAADYILRPGHDA